MTWEGAILPLAVAICGGVGGYVWLSDRREQRKELRYREDREERKVARTEIKADDARDLAAGLAAKKLAQEKELAREEMQLEDERSRHMAELGQKGRTQRQINSDQDEAMMETLGGLMSEYLKEGANKEAIKKQAVDVCGGNVVTLLRLLKKMGVDVKGLMG